MTVSSESKKQIANDWLQEFPDLSALAVDKLYKVIGPVIAGIELLKLPRHDAYSPYFVIYPLWKSNTKQCLDAPVLFHEFKSKKRLQFKIPYLTNGPVYIEAVKDIKAQLLISLGGDLKLNELFNLIDKQFDDILIRSNSAQQAKLFEFKFNSALYVNDLRAADQVIVQITDAAMNWNLELFNTCYGDLEQWISALRSQADHRSELIQQISVNRVDTKIVKLNSSGLV